jgi:hypothetical protein
MKRFFLFVCAVFFFTVTARAQAPVDGKFEIYGGYTYQFSHEKFRDIADSPNTNNFNLNGFHVGGTFWVNEKKTFGLVNEFSFTTQSVGQLGGRGVIPSHPRTKYYLGASGPIFRFGTGRVRPFVRGLFGVNRISDRISTNTAGGRVEFDSIRYAFTFAGGGGFDIDLKKNGRLAFRAVAIDYQFISGQSGFLNRNGLRVSTGLVVRF